MRGATTTLAWLHCLILLVSCSPLAPLPPSSRGPSIDAVRVVSNGWHAAIVVRRAELVETGLVPEAGDFPNAAFIEFGWGDRAYYPTPEPTLGMTLDAALRPTPAVMYMAGYTRPPERVYGGADTVPVAMSRQTFRHMVIHLPSGSRSRQQKHTGRRQAFAQFGGITFNRLMRSFHHRA